MAKKTEGKEIKTQGKEERIETIVKDLEKKFGKGTIIGAADKSREHDSISTGSIGLDKAIGIGGLPKGRIVEILGPESSGKTTLCIHLIAEAQKADPEAWCAFIDAEHCFDIGYAEALGVDLKRLKFSQPNSGEQALEIADTLIESGDFAVVIIDSVAALLPQKELEGEMGVAVMGGQARLMSQAMRKMTASTAKTGTLLVFINQLRDKIGVMFGSPETTTGGNALKFYASVRLDIRRNLSDTGMIKEGGEKVGNEVVVKVKKNKVSVPFREARFDIMYGEGIDKAGELTSMAIDTNIIEKSGAWLTYEEHKVQGKKAFGDLLKNDEKLFEKIKLQVLQKYQPVEFEITEEDV